MVEIHDQTESTLLQLERGRKWGEGTSESSRYAQLLRPRAMTHESLDWNRKPQAALIIRRAWLTKGECWWIGLVLIDLTLLKLQPEVGWRVDQRNECKHSSNSIDFFFIFWCLYETKPSSCRMKQVKTASKQEFLLVCTEVQSTRLCLIHQTPQIRGPQAHKR